ncbi:MAG: hypothetical protein QF926_06145 [Alphaproteobacteria bacterium]|nr:hypothetical protein [Alphaproteobacteria bacterium]MDP6516188.1 hypothetical protein [Alphaproteobacteria bacterium]
MAILEIKRSSTVKPESAYLRNFRKNETSQYGEDGVIEKIFDLMPPRNRWCVEFGAGDGKALSNSWRLLNEDGWRGVLFESDDEKFQALSSLYGGRDSILMFHRMIDAKGENSLGQLLAETGIPVDFDMLSIDVDGMDWYIWGSLAEYRPRLVLIEFNHSIPNFISFVQDDNATKNQGASLLAMIDLAKHKGYELIATTNTNAFFVPKETFPVFGITDNSIDAMHFTGDEESFLFQLYDGTLVLCGNTTLLWRQEMINQEDIQVLPRQLRVFQG